MERTSGARDKANRLKRLWPFLLLCWGSPGSRHGLHRHLTLEELAENREALRAAEANMPLTVLAFTSLFAATVALSLPVFAVLTIASGFLFGWLLGGFVSLVGATMGACIVFLIARSALGDLLAAKAGPWLARCRQGFQRDAVNYLLFLRLVPIFPFWLVNLAPGLLGVNLITFGVTTALGTIPVALAYALIGNGLDSVIEAQQSSRQSCLTKTEAGSQDTCPYALDPGALLTPELIAGQSTRTCCAHSYSG